MGDGSGTNSYPPVGDPDRYDMIVQRGRALRRRRRYSLGAGAGGTVVALAVAVVLITGGNNGNDVDATEMAADPTTTTTTKAPTTTVPTVVTSPPKDGAVGFSLDRISKVIEVEDLTAPVSPDALQCVQLGLTTTDGVPVAEGRACTPPGMTSGQLAIELWPSSAAIFCATSEVSGTAPGGPTEEVSTSFVIEPDPSIPPGTYDLYVGATSGVGDGCPGSAEGSAEVETFNEFTTQIELP